MGEYVYIDGGYLRECLKEFSKRYFAEGVPAEINYDRLFSRFEKKFYDDCLPARRKGEDDAAYGQRREDMQQFFNKL
jgi:hypothetical protein